MGQVIAFHRGDILYTANIQKPYQIINDEKNHIKIIGTVPFDIHQKRTKNDFLRD
jgi:hypothetical protein